MRVTARGVEYADLRPSAATVLLAHGEELRNIVELLRHSQISITADLCAHVLEASKRRMAEKMDALPGTARSS